MDTQESLCEKAIEMACERFERLHPVQYQPLWLKYCISINVQKSDSHRWNVRFLLHPKLKPKENQVLEWQKDGMPLLLEVNPETKQKSVVLCAGAPPVPMVLFEAEVNPQTQTVSVKKDTALNILEKQNWQMRVLYGNCKSNPLE